MISKCGNIIYVFQIISNKTTHWLMKKGNSSPNPFSAVKCSCLRNIMICTRMWSSQEAEQSACTLLVTSVGIPGCWRNTGLCLGGRLLCALWMLHRRLFVNTSSPGGTEDSECCQLLIALWMNTGAETSFMSLARQWYLLCFSQNRFSSWFHCINRCIH